jgi:hypothetical protein
MSVSLQAIAEDVWLQIGGGTDESRIQLEQVIQNATNEYAWQMLQLAWREKRENGEYIIPSYLSRETILKVKNNEADISDLNILKGIQSEQWLQQIGDVTGCVYTKTTINQAQLMADDDSLGEDARTYYVIGNKIRFPKGAHSEEVPMIYANDGSDLDSDEVIVDDAVGALVSERLLLKYLGKITPSDTTNNSNGNG